jgi:hypothetical protein
MDQSRRITAAARLATTAALAVTLLAPAAGRADPAAWRVRDDAGRELWLLGSVHFLRSQDYPLPPIIDELYDAADALVMELDMDDLDPLASQAAFVGAAMLPDGTGLADAVAPQVYRLAEERAASYGIDLRLLDRFEPWLVAVTLLNGGMAQRGFRADVGVEQYLLGKAAADGKEILGLESLATQIAVFDDLSAADQEALLMQTLQELDSPEAAITEMVEAWRDGRLETLADQLTEEFTAFPDLYDAIVVDRNEAWIDEMERLLSEGRNYLVVVGALHLVGEHSVVDLLRRRGLTVAEVE